MPYPGKVSLMIVEDDANVRFLLEAAARRAGVFELLTTAVDGLAALEKLRASETAHLPALIVTDLSMPRVNGFELLRALKSDERMRHIPVAVITSSDAPDDRSRALAAGACSYVHKPYGVDALVCALVAIRESCVETPAAASSV